MIKLLHHIKSLQSQGNSIYPKGLFPSQRFHTHLSFYRREDDNLFFSTVIVFTLQQLQRFFPKRERELINEITLNVLNTCRHYRNKNGLNTFNFWQTTPSRHFPNGYLLKRLDFLQLPDDADDTVLVYLISPFNAREVNYLRQKLITHANLYKKQIKNTLLKYRHLKAYGTWFGKNMYLEFDFCVLCNVMYFICKHERPLTENDRDTLTFLQSVIISDEHFTHPFLVAPSYPKTSLILYHVSRLISSFSVPGLSELDEKIIGDIHRTLSGKLHPMEKLLLSTCLMKLGENPLEITVVDPELYFKGFYFFNGGMLTAFENSLCRKLAKYDIFHLKHQCQAYNYTLLLEHEVLKNRLMNDIQINI